MGAGVSAGESNDELIDNLVEADYIKTSLIERVFRAVDRGNYILSDPQVNPYRDVAWKSYNFHISAPCIYSEVMEGLQLQSGLSFLNLGSGTGYLNTMVGLILGHNGINHGIELHQDVVCYANKKLDEFKLNSGALDEYDFCEPKFIQGNCLCIANGHYLYDRVYCGAACPDEYLDFIKNLVKIGGILIVPFNERLVEMKRISETNWNIRSLLPVSFANLVIPPRGHAEDVQLLDIEPLSLQELCRSCIRNLIRKTIEKEHPTITKTNSSLTRKATKKKRTNQRDICSRTRNGNLTTMCDREGIIDDFLFLISRRSLQPRSNSDDDDDDDDVADNDTTSENESNNTEQKDDDKKQIITETEMSEDDNNSGGDNGGCDEQLKHMHGVFVDILNAYTPQTNDNTTPSTSAHTDNDDNNRMDDSVCSDCGIKRKTSSNHGGGSGGADDDSDNNDGDDEDDDDDDDDKTTTNGEALKNPQIEIETDSSNDEFESETTFNNNNGRCRTTKWRRLNSNYNDKETNDNKSAATILKVYKSPYTDYVKEKITELPLPFILKKYLNFYRDL